MPDVVLHDARHGDLAPVARRVAHGVLIEDGKRAAHLKGELHRELLAHEHAVVGERKLLVPLARAHRDEVGEGVGMLGHDDVDAVLAYVRAVAGDGLRLLVRGGKPGEIPRGVFPNPLFHLGFLVRRAIGVHTDDGVVMIELAILLVDDVVDGVLQPQAREQKRRTAGDAHDRHDEAALVAEEVARSDLPGERQAVPQRADALEQDALAGLRGTRQHEERRALAQRRGRGEPGGDYGDSHAEPRGSGRHGRIDRARPTRNGVDDRVGAHDEPGQKLRERDDADNRTNAACHDGVDEVLRGDARFAVAERLERADEHTLLLHHARHGGKRDECRHEEEQKREDLRDLIDAARVRLEALGADVLREVEHVHLALGIRNRVHVSLGIGKLRLGIGELFLGVRALGGQLACALFVLREAILVFGAARGKLPSSRLQLGATAVDGRLRTCKLALGGIHARLRLGALLGKLGTPLRDLLGNARGLRVYLRDGGLKLRHDIVRARRLRLRELLDEHRPLGHGGVIACLGGVELGLRSRKLLLGSCALGVELRPPAVDLRLSARKVASARVDGRLRARELRSRIVKLRLRVVKFRLSIIKLLERIGALGLEVGSALVEFRLCIGPNAVKTRGQKIVGNTVDARCRRIDK